MIDYDGSKIGLKKLIRLGKVLGCCKSPVTKRRFSIVGRFEEASFYCWLDMNAAVIFVNGY
jgi:hypothetical protein